MFKSSLSKRVCVTLSATALSLSTLSIEAQLSGKVNLGGLLPSPMANQTDITPSIQAAFAFAQQQFNLHLNKTGKADWTLAINETNQLQPTEASL